MYLHKLALLDRLHSEEFDNFRKFGASSYSNSILTEDKYKQEAMEATAEADGADEYEDDDEEEDEDKVEIGDVGPGPPRSNQFPGFESDSSVLSGMNIFLK